MAQLTKPEMYRLLNDHGVDGELARIMVAGAWVESGWITDRIGDNGHSVGLFMLHENGLGAGLSRAERERPDVQVRVMAPEYQREYQYWRAEGYTGADLCSAVCGYAEKPYQYTDPHSSARKAYYAAWAIAAPEDEAPPAQVYDPDVPAERQVSSWACSIRTTAFLLHSIGDWISAEDLQDVMVPGLVTPALGLLQGDGSGLAAFLAAQTGLPTGHAWIDWDWLQAHAGTMPIGIGSPTLYHWVAVRTVLDADTLALANPAPGYQGLGDTMSRAQFEQWQPWACVYIEVPAENGGSDLSVEERAELNDLRSRTASYEHDTFEPLAATMDRILETPKLTKAAIVGQVREMRQSIRSNVGI